jgi:hypothetical protein
MDENILPIESAKEWASVAQPGDDSSELTVEQAANLVTRKREEEQGEEAPSIVERRYASNKEAVNLREAQADLSFSRKLDAGKQLLRQGLTPEQARDFVEAPEPPPNRIGLDGLEPLRDDDTIKESLSPHRAADLIHAWREKVAAEHTCCQGRTAWG